jgi:hypothetical protein
MKFNWGTGILIFLILFLLAAAAFIIFAMRQDVNLVHKDYYEKGVDYTDQMNVITRSQPFSEKIKVQQDENGLLIAMDSALATTIDSGKVLLYRPSGSNQDLEILIEKPVGNIFISADKLIGGRYILKAQWFTGGTRYETDQTVIVNK